MVPSSRDADVDVLLHSTPFGARSSRRELLFRVSNNREIQDEKQITAITSTVKTTVPKQKPSPNLIPDKNIVCSLAPVSIRLQQIDRPRLGGIDTEHEDCIFAIELTGNSNGGK
jgi:hypothetical protein